MRHDQPTAAAIVRLTAALALAFLVVGLLSSAAGAQLPGARPRAAQPGMHRDATHPPQPPEPPVPPSGDLEDDDGDDDAPWMAEGHGLGPCMDQLQLTDQQQSQIDDLRAQARRDMIRARGDVAKAASELHAQASDPAATRASIERAAAEVQRDRNALHDRMLKSHLDVREVLTAQQRDALAKCRWGGPHRGAAAHLRGAHLRQMGPRIHRQIQREVIRRRGPGMRGRALGWGGGWRNDWGRAWF